ncbi:MAG: SDR family oxidoreductase [Ilumatobacteraceae bacterium]
MTAITGSTAVVTGGARGIGLLVAERLARRGARVVLWDLDQTRLDAVVSELRARTGGNIVGHACNITDRALVRRAADRVRAEVGEVDIVVNNAGVVSGKRLLDIPDDKIENTFAVNTLALYWVTKAFLAGMIERNHGHVVTVASAAGLVGVARQTDYSASKHAAIGFDESLRVELAQFAPGVITTVVCPYYVDTGMFEGVKSGVPLLLPILRPERVADKIVAAIEHDRRVVVLPPSVRLLGVARLLPTRWFDKLMGLFGVNVSMDHFRGRADVSND